MIKKYSKTKGLAIEINNVSIACNKIIYLPELRFFCKSINSCLLMFQLEILFASNENEPCKFLAPCAHSCYKVGSSWIEELGFSEAEFRTAFDNIGVRYRSKKQLKKAIENNQDPFSCLFYLSYIDIKSGKTHYQRNHASVEKVLRVITIENKQKNRDENELLNFLSTKKIERCLNRSPINRYTQIQSDI